MHQMCAELDAVEDASGGPLVLVTINLRGTRFDVPRDAADHVPGSRLHRALGGSLTPRPPLDALGALYFNRNPTYFHSVLDVLADDDLRPQFQTQYEMEVFQRELLWWGVTAKRRIRGESSALGDQAPAQMRPAQPRAYGAAVVAPPAMMQSLGNMVSQSVMPPAMTKPNVPPVYVGPGRPNGIGYDR
jgi:hypothetical protein